MSVVLHRFPLSHFSEKARALLEFKKLPFRIQEHQLGLPQLGIYRMSGQRKVPVIEDDGRIVADSTEIGLYLEQRYPEPRFLPEDAKRRRDVLALEDRIDHVMGNYAPVVWFDWVAREQPRELARFISVELWGAGRGRVLGRVVRGAWRLPLPRRIVKKSAERTRALLLELCARLETSRYLCGDEVTLADIAVAGLALHLEFPKSRHLVLPDLAGVGVPGWADSPELQRFFEWRRQLYAEHLG